MIRWGNLVGEKTFPARNPIGFRFPILRALPKPDLWENHKAGTPSRCDLGLRLPPMALRLASRPCLAEKEKPARQRGGGMPSARNTSLRAYRQCQLDHPPMTGQILRLWPQRKKPPKLLTLSPESWKWLRQVSRTKSQPACSERRWNTANNVIGNLLNRARPTKPRSKSFTKARATGCRIDCTLRHGSGQSGKTRNFPNKNARPAPRSADRTARGCRKPHHRLNRKINPADTRPPRCCGRETTD